MITVIITVITLITIKNFYVMDCEVQKTIIIGVISGLFSSWLFWILLNYILAPAISSDKKVQHGKIKKYIRIYNENKLFDAYEIVCYIEYIYHDANNKVQKLYRTTLTLPVLKHSGGEHNVHLNGSKETELVFDDPNAILNITITYQNKLGIKKTIPVLNLKNSDEE